VWHVNVSHNLIRCLLACWLLIAVSGSVMAAPASSGSTGLISTPSADALRLGQFSAGYFAWNDQSMGVVGIGLPRGLELSAAVPLNAGRSADWMVNAKFNLNQEALLFPAVSIGIEDIDGRQRRTVYGVISKTLPFGFRIHLGTGSGRFEGMFGALEKVLNPTPIRQKHSGFPVTSVLIEMDGYKMNYGLRFRLAHGLRLDAGWQGRAERIYWGLSYTN
jgi:hypothetical protein